MIRLQHFKASEFRGHKGAYPAEFLEALDAFRAHWGRPVHISPAPGAMVRRAGRSASRHNIDRWGQCLAIDVFPEGMVSAGDRQWAVVQALCDRFTGVGVYPEWTMPGRKGGLHLGMPHLAREPDGSRHKPTRNWFHDPALWSAWPSKNRQRYEAIDAAMPPGIGREELINARSFKKWC
ncbi:MAG: hypothetical protein AAGF20_00315 [Pseudomonadota bacterium]